MHRLMARLERVETAVSVDDEALRADLDAMSDAELLAYLRYLDAIPWEACRSGTERWLKQLGELSDLELLKRLEEYYHEG